MKNRKPKFEYTPNISEQYVNWKPWSRSVQSMAANESTCINPKCGWVGLEFRGFQSGNTVVAVAHCPNCQNEFEF